MATLLRPPQVVVPQCIHALEVSLGILITSPYKSTSQIGLRPTLTALFEFNHLKALSPNMVTF